LASFHSRTAYSWCTDGAQPIVTVDRFVDTFETVGGVNLPKIVYCVGSDGQRYKQLVKVR